MTNRKIRDILPPKEVFSPPQKTKNRPEFKPNLTFKESLKPGKKKKILFFFLILLFFFSVFCYFVLPKAEIEIWPETEKISLETKITLDQNITQLFKKEKSLTETFQSTGKILKEEKAEGIIRVYNEYSEATQTLIATTRFVSADGKVFRTLERITVPGGTYEKGKLVPGEIDIKVVADEPGFEYNIEPTTFSIPGFAGTERYLKFYAKSFESMKGGFQEEITRVTEEDLIQAENALIQKAKKECQDILIKELEEKEEYYSFLEDVEVEIKEKFSLATAEEEKENFDFQIKASCQTLFFEKEYIKNHIKKIINEQSSDQKNLVEESLEINYFSEEIDLDSSQVELSLSFFAETYSEMNYNNLKNALAGKSLTEAEVFLKNQSKILKANINLWPFWVRKVPQNSDKIDLFLRFNSVTEI